MTFKGDLGSLGPVIRHPHIDRSAALFVVDRLGHDCADILDMLELRPRPEEVS